MTTSSAPGKIILCGEHAVVYGRPAVALPLSGVRAYAEVDDAPPGSGVCFCAPDLGRSWTLGEAPDDPISQLVERLLADIHVPGADIRITLSSDIPIASGMGSGAAIATALVRALATHFERALPPEAVSAIVYESERGYHGTPSGIDNTVVAFERPVWFVRPRPTDYLPPTASGSDEQAHTGYQSSVVSSQWSAVGRPTIEPIAIAAPLALLVGDTGLRSQTKLPVAEVRRRREADVARYEALFDSVGALAHQARDALAAGDRAALGPLLDRNHTLLQEIGVSSPELDRLVGVARGAGALGAKLSGAGWGGVMIALVEEGTQELVRRALLAAGAARILETTVAADQVPDAV